MVPDMLEHRPVSIKSLCRELRRRERRRSRPHRPPEPYAALQQRRYGDFREKGQEFCALQHDTAIPDGADFPAFVTSRQTNFK